MRWKTICFDLDNTLFSHEEAFAKAIKHCYEKTMASWKDNQIKQAPDADEWFLLFKKNSDRFWRQFEQRTIDRRTYRRFRYQQTMQEFDLPYSDEEADQFHEHYNQTVYKFTEPYEGLGSLFGLLHESGITLGIITNGPADTQYEKIKRLGISQYISSEQIFISEQLTVAKPNPAIFNYALTQLKHQPQDGKLYVGDSWEHDVIGALHAGWDAIYMNTRHVAPQSNESLLATCQTLPEVKNIIERELNLKG
ncbi:HAD family hydrolase [Alkalihalobacillus sp. LMS39]|uniref:HAD family hydrolase n=1 Tax=Alkalihalobacillus sp. LMS39 TaxID=2924032 RepID=UPI001FB2118B|nr:HAD family hydrolase [Alkalihalobacillus sp. LMS39]UOE95728.1 HAD family hydrolase [Alkalihalobacillus sp. LMS39]